jgi:NADPH-dependent glutamate synthase beta subunit-like oxidoreductase
MSELDILEIAPIDPDDEYLDADYIPAPCQQGCPLGTDIPSYVGLIAEEKLEAAFEVITASNPFPTICGRVCAKPCETQCRRGESDGAIAIRNLKRFVTEQVGRDYCGEPFPVTESKTVAIVGGGPTGLTAAMDLAEAGYRVHIYEKSDRLGGMMARGIPPFRLPGGFIEADVARILKRCPGIEVHLGCALGDEISLRELGERHDAVLLALGLWSDRKLGIPGEENELEGLHGIGFLTGISQGKTVGLEGDVVVVGGGNVAIDVARTALRSGAAKVDLFCLEARHEMPAWEHEVEEALEEGVNINFSWGPKRIYHENGKVTGVEFMRCTSVFDSEGCFNPSYDPAVVTRKDATSILVSIGLSLENTELEQSGLLEQGRIKADFETMRTAEPKVFAAGDCAFGASAIVYAIHHGHRAAHYMKAFLEGVEDPIPYEVCYSSRKVKVIQDSRWEKLKREEQMRCAASDSPLFEEPELTYDLETARRQAVRCLRCDAETGMSDYSRRNREHIQAMARTAPDDVDRLRELLQARLRPRNNPFPQGRPAYLDDVVFLPAALTRLVIDPYREACSTKTQLGKSLVLKQPYLFAGFDGAPAEVREALALALKSSGCGYIGFEPLTNGHRVSADAKAGEYERPDRTDSTVKNGGHVQWLQLILPGKSVPSPEADGLIHVVGREIGKISAERLHASQLLGIHSTAGTLPDVIPYALENRFDLVLLDGAHDATASWSELKGAPELTVIRDAIRILRELNREEDIDLVYFGGLRSGTDVAKVLALNCRAGVFGVAVGIAMSGVIADGVLGFPGDLTVEDRRRMAENWIKATAEETAIIARCTGKTNVHNLEPEDMRTITMATAQATDIPLASGAAPREYF